LQRKLASPEYKDIDERCRKTTIEHTTTLLAAEDLKKYYSAIDKVSTHATRYPSIDG
jgi:DNA repair protein RAD50